MEQPQHCCCSNASILSLLLGCNCSLVALFWSPKVRQNLNLPPATWHLSGILVLPIFQSLMVCPIMCLIILSVHQVLLLKTNRFSFFFSLTDSSLSLNCLLRASINCNRQPGVLLAEKHHILWMFFTYSYSKHLPLDSEGFP